MSLTSQAALSTADWRASSHSNGQGGACLEFAHGVPAPHPVRDSKDPAGPVLFFPTLSWTRFVAALGENALR